MINLMFCGNDRVFDGMLIALLSIAKNTEEDLNVFIITMDLTEQDENFRPIKEEHRKILEDKIKAKNKKNKVTLIDATEIYKKDFKTNTNNKTHYTPYIFLRLLSDVIPELPDKVLYLDTDIVCYKDIKEIYNTDMKNYEIAMALDYLGRTWIAPDYKNSGVVLINLEKVRKTGCFTKARNMCKIRKMALPDQTALNKCCSKILTLPDKYNEQKKRKEDTVIRHFSMTFRYLPIPRTVNIKPWQIEKIHNVYKIFDYEDIIEEYEKTKQKMKK